MKNESINAGSQGITLAGIAASPGIAIGVVFLVSSSAKDKLLAVQPDRQIAADDIPEEIARFQKAVEQTVADISSLRHNIEKKLDNSDASIFDAHLLIVDDKNLMKEVIASITNRRQPAEAAFSSVIQNYVKAMTAVQDQYLQERAADILDAASRVLENLTGTKRTILDRLPGQRIIISRDLSPSDTALLDSENVQAIITETGSRTSHSAILARSMKIPAVVGVSDIIDRTHNGDMVIVDGYSGTVIIDPSQSVLEEYAKKEASNERFIHELLLESQLRPETIDGYRIELAANIDDPAAISDVKEYGAAGVGLFRTEYLFINAESAPSEETQYQIYKNVIEQLDGQPLIIRTLDLGGDKLPTLLHFDKEANPFLGLRSVRLCLAHPDLLIPQLRAILRAGALGEVRMMFPMITNELELDELLAYVEKVRQDLTKENIKFKSDLKIGMMVETPAAAMFPERFAKKCDFFSIGTNDLVQYTMAVDRGNEKVANLYCPYHPVILRLIRNVVLAARKEGIWVSVCGEMAADPKAIPLLIGLGVQELSMSPVSISLARRVIRRMKFFEAESFALESLKRFNHLEVEEKALEMLRRIAPDICNLDELSHKI